MSALALAGWALVAIGAVMLVVAVVRSRRAAPVPKLTSSPLSEMGLSLGQAMRVVRRAQGEGQVAPDQVETVRTWAGHQAGQPVTPALGFIGVGAALAGVAALVGVSALGALWLAPAVVIATSPFTTRRRQARARAVLDTLPPR